ncbi:MAG: hypothetical protein GXY01_02820 [Clostridiales bacterium]|nr:hypothetical protein [Clostridiales bacterium]
MNDDISFDAEELVLSEETEVVQSTPRLLATTFLRRLKMTVWLEEREGGYKEETQIVVNHRIVPIIRSFNDVIFPQLITYKGKLFKIYKLLKSISEADSPYESVLREVSGDLDEFNALLRQLAASIGTYMDELTRGKECKDFLRCLGNQVGEVSLVDTFSLERDSGHWQTPEQNMLANKIGSENHYAKQYVSCLLHGIVCCEIMMSLSSISKACQNSIQKKHKKSSSSAIRS